MKETGQLLKNAREKQNVSVAAVSAVTKINVKFLEAIEKADTENLPSKTFLRGFVQTYANFLKLDQNEIMEVFHREMGSTRYAPPVNEIEQEATNGASQTNASATENLVAKSNGVPERPLTNDGLAAANGQRPAISKVIFGGLAVFLLVSIYVVFQLVQKYQQESQVPQPPAEVHTNALPANKPEEKTEELKATDEAVPKVEDEQKAEQKVEPKTNANEEPAKAEVTKVEPPKPVEPKKPEEKVETAKPVEKPAEKPEEPAKPVETPKPPEAAKPPEKPVENKTAQEVVIEALDSVKVDFRIDGGTLQSVSLQPEEKRTLRAKKNLNIDVSDGGAVNVNHNGKDKGVPGNLGQPIKLSFP
ncbi:MAG: helix-turn-helix domain-containing protein [Bdellovibrionales bacterium]